jgi:hypothetical protein
MSEQTHPEHGTPEQGAASETTAANEHGFGIDEAIGVIMAQERYTQAQAFAILRGASQNRNLKLRDIAVRIVTSVSGRPPQLPPSTTAAVRSPAASRWTAGWA